MDNQVNKTRFNDILKQLEKKMNYYYDKSTKPKGGVLNRINLDGFKGIQEKYSKNRLLCKKVLEVKGRWRLDINYGPQFEMKLRTERAGEILVQTDETIMLGGGGTAIHPISLCMAGFGGCFTAAFAKWSAMQNIELKTLNVRAKANIDLSSSFGIDDNVPMIDNYQLDLFVESDATMEKIREILELTKLRCFCYYCATTPVFPTVLLSKERSNKKQAEIENYHNHELNAIEVQNVDYIVNRINLKGFKAVQKMYSENRSLCKKTLEVEGKWKLDVQYGPQYQTKLQTERAGEILLQTDETIILGGGGTSFHPVHLCMAGFAANFCSEYAKWAAIEGVKLNDLEIIIKQYVDLTTSFGIEPNIPMIDNYQVELIVDSNANIEKLLDILEITKKRSFCYYCLITPTVPLIMVHKIISDNQDKSFKVVNKELILESDALPISGENNLLLNSIFKKRKVMQMRKI